MRRCNHQGLNAERIQFAQSPEQILCFLFFGSIFLAQQLVKVYLFDVVLALRVGQLVMVWVPCQYLVRVSM